MPMCRVFQNVDGSVRLMHPNKRLQLLGETDADFTARVCSADRDKDPSLAGLPSFDVNTAALPTRNEVDAQGDSRSVRNAWRRAGNAVVVDVAAIAPNWGAFTSRLHKGLTAARRLEFALELAALKEATATQDTELLQAAVAQLAGKMTPPEIAVLRLTLNEKKLPATV